MNVKWRLFQYGVVPEKNMLRTTMLRASQATILEERSEKMSKV
jgi:hypothetical protein